MDWYVLTLVSLVLYAVQGLLFKFAALKGCDRNLTTFFYLFTVTVISVPFLLIYGITQVTYIGLILAIVYGIFYTINTLTRIEALKSIPATILYPILRLNNAVLVVIFILVLGERVTLQNSIGIILAIASLFLLTKGEKPKVRTLEEGI